MSLLKTLTENALTIARTTNNNTTQISPQQAVVLSIINHSQTPLRHRQRLQKYTFLIDQALDDGTTLYNWRTYDYGPHSQQLRRDIINLTDNGFITEHSKTSLGGTTQHRYELTTTGEKELETNITFQNALGNTIRSVVNEHEPMHINELIQTVLNNNPEYKSTVYKQLP